MDHPRVYLFRAGECFYSLVVAGESGWRIYRMTLPDSGLGRAALMTSMDECPPEAVEFFNVVLEGEKLRDEFTKRGAY